MRTFPRFRSKSTLPIYKRESIGKWQNMIYHIVILIVILEASQLIENFFNPATQWTKLIGSKIFSWCWYFVTTVLRVWIVRRLKSSKEKFLNISDFVIYLFTVGFWLYSVTRAPVPSLPTSLIATLWTNKEILRFYGIYLILSLTFFNWFYQPLAVGTLLIIAAGSNLIRYEREYVMIWLPTYIAFIACFSIFSYALERLKRNNFEDQTEAFENEKIWKQILNGLPHGIIAVNKKKEIFYFNDALFSSLNLDPAEEIDHLSDINNLIEITLECYNKKNDTEISTVVGEEQNGPTKFKELQKNIWERWDLLEENFNSLHGDNEDYLVYKGTYKVDDTRTKSIDIKFSMKNFAGETVALFIFSDISERVLVDSLKQTIEYKNRLLASVSHELRTPLNGNINFIQAAIKDKIVPKYVKDKFLIPAIRSAKYLLTIINDILDFSQIHAESLKLVPTNKSIVDTAREAIELIDLQAQKKKIKLELQLPSENWDAEILTDHNRLLQIMANLLSNALKFTFTGGIILRLVPESEYVIQVEVEDTGVGIKKEDQPKLFKTFGKVDHDGKNYMNSQGVGLGLVISNALAKRLRRKDKTNHSSHDEEVDTYGIQFESEFGRGSKFYFKVEDLSVSRYKGSTFTIPIEGTAKIEIPEFDANDFLLEKSHKPSSTVSIKKLCECPSILIADDDAFNLLALENILHTLGYTTESAYNGAQVLDHFNARINSPCCADCEPYKLVFLDCNMPIMDGYECMTNLKKLFQQRPEYECPVIACTAAVQVSERQKAQEVGMKEFLTKPVSKNRIQELMTTFYLKKTNPRIEKYYL